MFACERLRRFPGRHLRNWSVQLCASTSSPLNSAVAEPAKKEKRPHERRLPGGGVKFPPDFRFAFPDFLPRPMFQWRHPIRERLERLDMLRRRRQLEVPEFYVGSILAVTVADRYAPGRTNRFVGICIYKANYGLMHNFALRNVVDGIGIEIKYDLYNPLIRKIEVLRLEKRMDDHLRYLRDALPEYSTFPFNMEPIPHPMGTPIPVNPIKVKLKPWPWTERWEIKWELVGIDDECIKELYTRPDIEHKKNIVRMHMYPAEPWVVYDLMKDYRASIPAEDQQKIFKEMVEYQKAAWKEKGRRHKIFSHWNTQVTETSKNDDAETVDISDDKQTTPEKLNI